MSRQAGKARCSPKANLGQNLDHPAYLMIGVGELTIQEVNEQNMLQEEVVTESKDKHLGLQTDPGVHFEAQRVSAGPTNRAPEPPPEKAISQMGTRLESSGFHQPPRRRLQCVKNPRDPSGRNGGNDLQFRH